MLCVYEWDSDEIFIHITLKIDEIICGQRHNKIFQYIEISAIIRIYSLQILLFTFQTVQHGFPHKPSALAYDPKTKLIAIGTHSGAIKVIRHTLISIFFVVVFFASKKKLLKKYIYVFISGFRTSWRWILWPTLFANEQRYRLYGTATRMGSRNRTNSIVDNIEPISSVGASWSHIGSHQNTSVWWKTKESVHIMLLMG